MKEFWLTQEQIAGLREAHRQERNKPAAYKINAVILLGSGWNLRDVKEALLLDEETLRSYAEKYKSGGIERLIETQYRGKESQLDESQQKKLAEELNGKVYLTTNAVIEFVQASFGMKYSPSGMRDLLHRVGYEYKKPKLVPGGGNWEEQDAFAEMYEKFMETKPADVQVYFADAVHPQHNTQPAYGWFKRGEPRVLPSNTGRDRLNLHGAINIETQQMTVIEQVTVNKDATLQLLEVLENKHPKASEIVVILDNAPYHYAKTVREWVKGRRVKLVFLPTYSPQLNLIERVWKFLKKKVMYNQYYETLEEFRKASIQFFSRIGQYSDELASLLDGGFEDLHYA